jgi:hypothetical protein
MASTHRCHRRRVCRWRLLRCIAFPCGSLEVTQPGLAIMPCTSRRGKAAEGPAMSLNAWERQALDSIKNGLAGSDPELAALLSAFDRLASDAEMPDREKMQSGSRRALRRLHRARLRARLRRARQRLGFQRSALLLWLLTTAVLIAAIVLAVNVGGGHETCPQEAVMICTGPTPGHSAGSPSHRATISQVPRQHAVGTPQTGP